MKSSMKRLAKDQVSLRKSLPPNYLFEDPEAGQSLPDDLTKLLILVTGPEGTPYSQGVWHLRLNIPLEYPQQPPTATFKTRIFHPNVAEETGAVCLETLKRDWDPKLTLRDILVTISCLLIQPNPDSALNQKAGALIQDDYEAFARQAKLMTRIHAPIPDRLVKTAQEAKRRGEETEAQNTLEKSGSSDPVHKPDSGSILKENHPSLNIAELHKAGRQPPVKRPITDATSTAPVSSQEHESQERPRKSPKHQHLTSQLEAEKPFISACRVEPEIKDTALHDAASQKIVFRAQWSTASGILRTKARIGIRRL